MGFVAVARVTEGRWVACKVLDGINFGLKEGGELVVETTICHEIRATHEAVAIDDVAASPYSGHHTPLQYGFQSYISVPIVQKDGSLFGTLCAIDPKPAKVNNKKTLTMFRLPR
jgi:GAF domain-containing protein